MNKDKYGEVFTSPEFIQEMIENTKNIMGDDFFTNINTIFEPGSGKGVFFDVLQNKNKCFKNNFHYYFNEINNDYFNNLTSSSIQYKKNVSFFMQDVLTIPIKKLNKVDLIIGNLPFNVVFKKFVPGLYKKNIEMNTEISKNSSKSITLWNKITHFCFNHILKENGYFFCIIPCIWLKQDRAKIYHLFTQQYTIHFLKVFDCKEANKIFHYNCQTPICYVLVQKKRKIENLSFLLFNHHLQKYQPFILHHNFCIPTKMSSYFSLYCSFLKENPHKNCFEFIKKISSLDNNCISQKLIEFKKGGLEKYIINENNYKIITGSNYDKKTNYLSLNGFISKNPGLYYGKQKLILPHKRLAKFIKDYHGTYSCIGRDMYVFLCNNKEEIDKLYDFFNIPFINNIIQNSFTIRMNFIEKHIFQYLPWIFDTNFSLQKWQLCCIY